MTSEIEYTCNNCGHEGINTRAVPDVPELVRYDLACDFNGKYYPDIIEVELGEYVRYDQAAEIIRSMIPRVNNCGRYIAERNDGTLMYLNHGNTWQGCDNFIAAKDKDIAGWKDVAGSYANKFATTKLELNAAEAELAQVKAQEPVVWRCKPYAANAAAWEYQDAPFNGRDPEFNEQQPLYAAPVDHTAEIERLREAINGMADEAGDAAYQFCRSYIGSEHEDAISSAVSARIQRVSEAALSGKEPS